VGTPEWQKEKVRRYYQATNEKSFLAHWAGKALSYHYGLSDDSTTSLDEAHLKTNAYIADALGIVEGMDVLDAGCGVGGTSIWLAKERGARVVGVTLDPQQVELATGFAQERGVAGKATFRVADFAATGFPPRSFDVAFNIESVCHCIDYPAYFAHVRELLRDGGRYGTMDSYRGSGHDELAAQVAEGWAMPHWHSMDRVADDMRAAGFEDVEVKDLTPLARRSAEQLKAMATNGALVMRLQHAIDGKRDEDYEGHVRGAIAMSEALLCGAARYGFVSGVVHHGDKG
jgi:tocopherol O-methyltransferase